MGEIKLSPDALLAWCISNGANVKFYQDGSVNLYFYPNEDASEPIEAHGDTLEEGIKEAEQKAKVAE